MKLVDLTYPISDGMPVYPGDPAVSVHIAHRIESHGWELRELSFGSHTSTHVDAFSHMDEDGANLDQIPLDRFLGPAVCVSATDGFPGNVGLIFRDGTIDEEVVGRICQAGAGFVGISIAVEFSVEAERALLKAGVLTFTCLVNVEQLPTDQGFTFVGLPLKIKDGDGSPVRAAAILSD